MNSNSIKILQIGDIHYPQAILQSSSDYKDSRISLNLTNSINGRPFEIALKSIANLLQKKNVSSIALIGLVL